MRVVAKDYSELIAALNRRRAELCLTLSELDELSGLADRHCSKLLSATPTKFIGTVSLPCLLAALGLKIIIVDDPAALERIKGRLARRAAPMRHQVVAHRTGPNRPQEPAERGAAISAV
jgi:hypothetical protein